MTTIVATANIRYTLSDPAFETALRKVLGENPDLLGLQEAGTNRDHIIRAVCLELGYAFARAKGGGPVLWRLEHFAPVPLSVKPIRLAGREYVGHLPGRKDRLPASIATEVILYDTRDTSGEPAGGVTVVLSYHLTAEVQMGAGYRKDLAHRLRVMRHKREKRRLGHRARTAKRRGREVYPMGDGNFDGMTLGGFVSCWEGRDGGTLGPRAVDIVFADRAATRLHTIPTASDHDALIVTYKEQP